MSVVFIGLCGGSGAGKTSISNALCELSVEQTEVLSLDSYYKVFNELSYEKREMINFDHPDTLDCNLLIEHLNLLKQSCAIYMPQYSFEEHCRLSATKYIEPKQIIIVEGIFLLHYEAIRNRLDMRIFINVKDETRISRIIDKNVRLKQETIEEVMLRYDKYIKPMHDLYIEKSKRFADIIIDGNKEFQLVLRDVCKYLFELTNLTPYSRDECQLTNMSGL